MCINKKNEIYIYKSYFVIDMSPDEAKTIEIVIIILMIIIGITVLAILIAFCYCFLCTDYGFRNMCRKEENIVNNKTRTNEREEFEQEYEQENEV